MKLRSVMCALMFLMSVGICVAAAPNPQILSPLHYNARMKSLVKLLYDYGGIPGEYDREPLFLLDDPARKPLYLRAMVGDESVRSAFKQIIAEDPTDYAAYLTYLTLGNRTITRQQFNHENSALSKELARAPHNLILLTRMALLWANGGNILVKPGGRGQNIVLGSSPQAGRDFMSHTVAVTRSALANSPHLTQPIVVFQLQFNDGVVKYQSVIEPCDQRLINGLIFRYGGRVMYGQYIKALHKRFLGSAPVASNGTVPNVRALVSVLIEQQFRWEGFGEPLYIKEMKGNGLHPLPAAIYKRAINYYRAWISKLVSEYHIDLKGTYYSLLNENN